MLCKCKQIITVATDAELLNKHYYRRLWLAVRNLNLPRRSWLDAIADCLRDFNGEIIYCNGEPYPLPFVDDVFEDPEMRWISHFLDSDATGEQPKSYSKRLEKLRLIDLYFRIAHPKIYFHFGR